MNIKNVKYYTIIDGRFGNKIYLDKNLYRRDIIAGAKYKVFDNLVESIQYFRSHGIYDIPEPTGLLSHLKKT